MTCMNLLCGLSVVCRSLQPFLSNCQFWSILTCHLSCLFMIANTNLHYSRSLYSQITPNTCLQPLPLCLHSLLPHFSHALSVALDSWPQLFCFSPEHTSTSRLSSTCYFLSIQITVSLWASWSTDTLAWPHLSTPPSPLQTRGGSETIPPPPWTRLSPHHCLAVLMQVLHHPHKSYPLLQDMAH